MAEFSDYVEARNSTSPTTADVFVIVQGGVAKRYTASQLQTLFFGSSIDNETPTGDIDDVNDTFTLANNPTAATVKVYLNGVRLKETDDYTISGTTLTFLTPPLTGDTLLVDYRI